jgi:uncharacterized membrane protein YraQ (UPF0718 family)
MLESLIEVLPEVGYAAAATVLAIFGVTVELNGLQSVAGGDLVVGVWMAVLGGVALYACLELTREKVVPGLRRA